MTEQLRMTKTTPSRAAERYARWLVFWYSRGLPHEVVVAMIRLMPAPKPQIADLRWFRMALDPRDLLQANMMLYGMWDPPLTRWLAYLAASSQTIFDLGAHCGYFSLVMRRFAPASAHIHAFEPNQRVREAFLRNVELNGFSHMHLSPFAVGDQEGETTFYFRDQMEPGISSTHRIFRYDRVATVPMIRLDTYCDQAGIHQADLLKIDVEGAEAAVIQGMKRGLGSRYGILLIEGHPRQLAAGEAEELLSALDAAGYHLLHIRDGYAVAMTDRVLPQEHIMAIHPDRLASLHPTGSGESLTIEVPPSFRELF